MSLPGHGTTRATWAEDKSAIARLVEEVASPTRQRPLVCITKQSYVSKPLIDADLIACQLDGIADVWVVGRPGAWLAADRGAAGRLGCVRREGASLVADRQH